VIARWGSAALLTLVAPLSLSAQAVLAGTVRADSTGAPIAGVEIVVEGTAFRATTGPNGRYVIGGLTPGNRTVLFRSVGYHPVRTPVLLVQADTTFANALMVPGEVILPPIEVRATPDAPRGMGVEGLAERKRLGMGRFYEAEELRKSEHLGLNDLLRRKGGVLIESRRYEGSNIWVAFHPHRRDAFGVPNCIMQIYLNGTPVGRGGLAGLPGTRPEDLRLFDISSLEAVEVYRSAAQVPPEYGGATGGCGVILLWSRQK
jgi:hypothetical protein